MEGNKVGEEVGKENVHRKASGREQSGGRRKVENGRRKGGRSVRTPFSSFESFLANNFVRLRSAFLPFQRDCVLEAFIFDSVFQSLHQVDTPTS